VYTRLKGWQSNTEGVRSFDDLPELAAGVSAFLERESGAKIGMVSTVRIVSRRWRCLGFAQRSMPCRLEHFPVAIWLKEA